MATPDRSLTTFALFPKFPSEIRLIIWSLTLPQSRIVEIYHRDSYPTWIDGSGPRALSLIASSDPITLLSVNCESRAYARRKYSLLTPPYFKTPFYLSPETDVLVMYDMPALKDFCSNDIGPWTDVAGCARMVVVDLNLRSYYDQDYWNWIDLDEPDPYPGDARLIEICVAVKKLRNLSDLVLFYDLEDDRYTAEEVEESLQQNWNEEGIKKIALKGKDEERRGEGGKGVDWIVPRVTRLKYDLEYRSIHQDDDDFASYKMFNRVSVFKQHSST